MDQKKRRARKIAVCAQTTENTQLFKLCMFQTRPVLYVVKTETEHFIDCIFQKIEGFFEMLHINYWDDVQIVRL